MTSSITLPILGVEAKILYQDLLEKGESGTWEKKFEASFKDGFWWVPDGRPIAPPNICYDLYVNSYILRVIVGLRQW